MSDLGTSSVAADNASELSLDDGESNGICELDEDALRIATRVVTTVELLDIVLSFLERVYLTKTALVSQFWLEASRRHIWHEVENAWELFGLLAPLKAKSGNTSYVRFISSFVSSNLTQFNVRRSLSASQVTETGCASSHSRRECASCA